MDNSAAEYFLSLADCVERSVKGDALAEELAVKEYTLTDKMKEETAPACVERYKQASNRFSFRDSYRNCHSCDLWMNRQPSTLPAVGTMKQPYMLFLSPCMLPDGSFLTRDEIDYFKKWLAALTLKTTDIGLSAIVKCPGGAATAPQGCLSLLEEEVRSHKPRVIVFFSGARACAGVEGDTYLGIPLYDLWSPGEVLADRSLRKPVWEKIKEIAVRAGLSDHIREKDRK